MSKKYFNIPQDNFEIMLLVIIFFSTVSIVIESARLILDIIIILFITIFWIILKILYRKKVKQR